MLTRRLVICLDVDDGRVVKGTAFEDLHDVGDPVSLAEQYEAEGADEIVFLDISASAEGRATLMETVRQTAERLFIPLTVGGGVRSTDDVGRVLRAGADKVSVNTAAVDRPEILTEAAGMFGSQCVVASIDSKREGDVWRVFTHGGRIATGLDTVDWARRCAELGAGEILLTSIDRDGSRDGYDLELTRAVADAVGIPVIASGGAGTGQHVVDVLGYGSADAALVAGMVHDKSTSVGAIKQALKMAGMLIRPVGSNEREVKV